MNERITSEAFDYRKHLKCTTCASKTNELYIAQDNFSEKICFNCLMLNLGKSNVHIFVKLTNSDFIFFSLNLLRKGNLQQRYSDDMLKYSLLLAVKNIDFDATHYNILCNWEDCKFHSNEQIIGHRQKCFVCIDTDWCIEHQKVSPCFKENHRIILYKVSIHNS